MDRIAALPLDAATKGMPLASGSIPLGEVGAQNWNVRNGDLTLPVLILRDERLRNNLEVMRRFAEHHGVSLAPHGKSTFCPQLYRDQVEIGGAWGITASTVQQAALVAGAGVENILIANEIVGRAAVQELARLRQAHPGKSFTTLVDSEGAMDELARHGGPMLRPGERFRVLVEVGFPGGRAGVRTLDQARALIEGLMKRQDVFELVGVECYEGLVSRQTEEETLAEINRLLDLSVDVHRLAEEMGAFDGLAETILTAGGSVYFDRVVERYRLAQLGPSVRIILRGGSSLTYDHGVYHRQLLAMDRRGGLDMPGGRVKAAETFTPALELWATVLTMQDANVAVLNMGIRDLPFDMGLPIPLRQYRDGSMLRSLSAEDAGFAITASNDQHCYMRYPEGADLRVGDAIACGISHPCTAFDKWDVVYRVDRDFNVIGAVKTFF
jgi:D-serine dehydratase